MLFDSWDSLGRVLLACVIGYVAVVAYVRVAGKRTLSKMNAYDVVINVALGSTLATMILSSRVPIVNGLAALAALIALQTLVSFLAQRSPHIHALVKAEPSLLYFRGEMQHATLRRERITEGEVRAAVRAQGLQNMDDVEAVILETTGDLSVITAGHGRGRDALDAVWPEIRVKPELHGEPS